MGTPFMPPPPPQDQEQNAKKQLKMLIPSSPSSSSLSPSMAANDLTTATATPTDHPVVLVIDHETQSLDELLSFWTENDGYGHDNYLQNLEFQTGTQFQELRDHVINNAQHEPSVLAPIPESEFVNEIIAGSSDMNSDPNFVMNPTGCSYAVTTSTGDQCPGNVSSLPLLLNVSNDDFGNLLSSQEEEEEIGSADQNYESSVRQINIWPPLPLDSSLISCVCCQILRDILHSNGMHTTKLEIHGKIGLICHAILEIRDEVNGSIGRQSIDFSTQSIEEVRQFLTHYCQERAKAGFVMLQDPLLTFYSALCAGANLNIENTNTHDSILQPIQSETTGVYEMSNHAEDDSSIIRFTKRSIAAQRERTGKLKLSDLVGYFHLPIEVAAKKLAICPTVLKKICRKHGMRRWPHRKIKSVDRQISSLRQSLREKTGEESAVAHTKIEMLKRERDRILNCMSK